MLLLGRSFTKAGRLIELQECFWRRRFRPLSTADLAERLEVTPRTVRRYLKELSASGKLPVVYQGHGWVLEEGAEFEILPIRLTVEEAAGVYLAARLLYQCAHEPNQAVSKAIEKLAVAVPTELRSPLSHLADLGQKSAGDDFENIFRTLAHGWALRQTVELDYEPRSGNGPFTCRFNIYLMESSPMGSALYIIGHADPPGAERVYKIERIVNAKLTEDTYLAPDPEALLDRLHQAWGVWMGEGELTEVSLRFSPQVAGRVQETTWHPSQLLKAQADGSLKMNLQVSSVQEILPWVLGWGAQCRVLEPSELREMVLREIQGALENYENLPKIG